MYIVLHIKHPLFLLHFNETRIFVQTIVAAEKVIGITYSEFAFVALGTKRKMRMRCIVT